MEIRRGVYFLANNKVYDLAIAFLNSFRFYNKTIEICLIPFNDDCKKIVALRDDYNFTIFQNRYLLEIFDNLSVRFHGKVLGVYRKLAAWSGDFDEFAYIDLDTIVLDNIDFVFENLAFSPVFTSHSNYPQLIKWVWKDSIYTKDVLSLEQIEYSANTGFFVSKRGILSLDFILSRVDSALELKDDMVLDCMEQPFLNYLIVTSGYEYGSLSQFFYQRKKVGIKLECWAGDTRGIVTAGKFYIPNSPPIFLLHWAGLWQMTNGSPYKIPYGKFWFHYRNLNLKYYIDPVFYDEKKSIFSRFYELIYIFHIHFFNKFGRLWDIYECRQSKIGWRS